MIVYASPPPAGTSESLRRRCGKAAASRRGLLQQTLGAAWRMALGTWCCERRCSGAWCCERRCSGAVKGGVLVLQPSVLRQLVLAQRSQQPTYSSQQLWPAAFTSRRAMARCLHLAQSYGPLPSPRAELPLSQFVTPEKRILIKWQKACLFAHSPNFIPCILYLQNHNTFSDLIFVQS